MKKAKKREEHFERVSRWAKKKRLTWEQEESRKMTLEEKLAGKYLPKL